MVLASGCAIRASFHIDLTPSYCSIQALSAETTEHGLFQSRGSYLSTPISSGLSHLKRPLKLETTTPVACARRKQCAQISVSLRPGATAESIHGARPFHRRTVVPKAIATGVAVAEAPATALTDEQILDSTPGLGAILDAVGGCVFRVWAPEAQHAELVLLGPNTPEDDVVLGMRREGGNFAARAPGVRAGAKYYFIFHHNGEKFYRRDARARYTDFDGCACYVVDPSYDWAPFEAPTWDKLVLYQVHVGAFTGRDEGGGTFNALATKVDYIKSLGFNAIQLMPVTEFGGLWGYNPRLLTSTHQAFGTPAELQSLVDTCHKAGIAVIFDVVLNHGAAKLNSLWAYDGWNPDNGGGIYHHGAGKTPWGKKFAFGRWEVDDYILEGAEIFLRDFNGDGLRFDSVHNMPWQLLQRMTWTLHDKYPGKILISEITPEDSAAVSSAGFDATWIHSTFFETRKYMEGDRALGKVQHVLGTGNGFSKPTQMLKYVMGCHDQIGCRNNGAFCHDIGGLHRYPVDNYGGRNKWGARAIARMWYAAMIAGSGIPMAFMGTECHHDGWWHVEQNRCFNWWFAGDPLGQEMMRLVTSANNLRTQSHALGAGGFDTVHFDDHHKVLGFRRESNEQTLLIIVNAGSNQWENSDYGVGVGDRGTGRRYVERFNSQDASFGGWEGSGNAGRDLHEHGGRIYVNVPKWSTLIFEVV